MLPILFHLFRSNGIFRFPFSFEIHLILRFFSILGSFFVHFTLFITVVVCDCSCWCRHRCCCQWWWSWYLFCLLLFSLNFPQRWTGRKHWNNCWYANESSISTNMLRFIWIRIGINTEGASLDNRSGKLNWIELEYIHIDSLCIGFSCACVSV